MSTGLKACYPKVCRPNSKHTLPVELRGGERGRDARTAPDGRNRNDAEGDDNDGSTGPDPGAVRRQSFGELASPEMKHGEIRKENVLPG